MPVAPRVLEDGRPKLIEGTTTVRVLDGAAPVNALLLEDNTELLLEDNTAILLE